MVPLRLCTGQGIGWCWTTHSRYYNGFTLTRQMLDQGPDFSVHMVSMVDTVEAMNHRASVQRTKVWQKGKSL